MYFEIVHVLYRQTADRDPETSTVLESCGATRKACFVRECGRAIVEPRTLNFTFMPDQMSTFA